ncbi:hypothetical protein N7492_005753 [Penicillium capsulatum]|uniref:ABC-2 type transporter domain-containing protein n=1 Tax=Penicillium capsulatum TaxID=69766 RepID=A0A9W9IA90_9EURO|nr:hypothetical protein N7492_005753 [Penicillium capsulatum]KAJ6135147.1 hypothetical protein N7512_000307 [Penicillium capsulatum]
MHPWLKWLKWINPVQYAFEGLMANEFEGLEIKCEPPFVVPNGPGAYPSHQECTIQGSSPDSLTVQGSEYIETAFGYSRGHMWRNFRILSAWLAFFIVMTMIGMELQKPNKGGSSVTIFKRGEAPDKIEEAIEKPIRPGDIELGIQDVPAPGMKEVEPQEKTHEITKSMLTWVAFVVSAILPELPYSIVTGSIYFHCWYWGVWFPRDSFSSGYIWMLLMVFELYYVGLDQFVAYFAPNELFASLLVPSFFTFIISFCGVMVPYLALPTFWQSWMYYLTPFTYLVEGFLGVATRNVPVHCSEHEEARFTPPSGMTCLDYFGAYANATGGYVRDTDSGLCAFCQYSNGDHFSAGLDVFYDHRWRDLGIFWAFTVINFAAVFLFSWLYLHGVQGFKRGLGDRRACQ